MNFKLSAIFFVLTGIATQAMEKGKPLLFPAKQNNIQPLPQKFEYSLRDAYRLLLGNRIIDTSNFEFIIRAKKLSIEVDLKWPENLFDKGTITVLSPSGVSVWSATLNEKQNFLSIKNANELMNKVLGLSFFKFCISQYELNTGMEVCSPEFVAKGSGGKTRVESKPTHNKSRVQINSRSVTDHGIVFLNDEKESLSFRATAGSGAEFKMDTRSINLEFLDVVDISPTLMAITIKGPFPLAPSQYKIIRNDIWTVNLKKDRALVYIAGEGKVPLRQEFVVQGALPTENHRLYIENDSPTHAYASGLELRGWAPQKGQPQAADSYSDVSAGGNRFSWSLKNLTVGQDKMSTIQIADGKDIFTAGYTFSRAYANRVEFLGGINSYKNNIFVGGEGQMWLESLPMLTRISQQKVGLGLIYNLDLIGKDKTTLMEFDFYWRLKRGLQFIDATTFFGLGIQNFSFETQSIQTFAPMIGWVGPAFKKMKRFNWQEFYLKQTMPGKSGSFELKNRTELKWKVYQPLREQRKIRYSAGFYSEDAAEARSGILLEAAWVMIF